MSHPVVHIEIASADPEASGRFYADLFGWRIASMPEMDYIGFETEPQRGGGFPRASDQMPAGQVVFYVVTDDIEKTLAHAERLGATTAMPKTEIPGTGWMAMFRDPHGALVGLYAGMS